MYVYGKVTDTKGNGIPGVVIETWETDGNGLYDNQVCPDSTPLLIMYETDRFCLQRIPIEMDQNAEAEFTRNQMEPIVIELLCKLLILGIPSMRLILLF